MFIDFRHFIADFGLPAIIITSLSVFVSLWSLAISITSILTNKFLPRLKTAIYVLSWVIGISLVVWYPDHRYPHYLDLALIPLLLIVIEASRGFWRYLMAFLLLVTSIFTISLSTQAHWTTNRALMVEKAKTVLNWHTICQHNSIVFLGPEPQPRELSYSLSLASGPRILCNNPDLAVYYSGLDNDISSDAYPIDITKIFK